MNKNQPKARKPLTLLCDVSRFWAFFLCKVHPLPTASPAVPASVCHLLPDPSALGRLPAGTPTPQGKGPPTLRVPQAPGPQGLRRDLDGGWREPERGGPEAGRGGGVWAHLRTGIGIPRNRGHKSRPSQKDRTHHRRRRGHEALQDRTLASAGNWGMSVISL